METKQHINDSNRDPGLGGKHGRVGAICAAIAFGMLGMAYAAVPLYQIFCQVTGFAGTPKVSIAPSASVIEKRITVRFDSNVSPNLDWTFRPKALSADIKIGENDLAMYIARNDSDKTVTGTATFNVTPEFAGAYFNKIECFCFTEQTLEPGQSVEMAVSYFIDPAIVEDEEARDLSQITLSYTFFAVDKKKSEARADDGRGKVELGKRG